MTNGVTTYKAPFKLKAKIVSKSEKNNKLTIDELFKDWNGEEYDRYDWGELEKPIGRELI